MRPGQRLFLAAQYLVPHHALSAVVYRAARWRWRPWKNLLIRVVARLFGIDLSEPRRRAPHEFVHFNDFFTRELEAGARPLDPHPGAVLSPCDGTVSQAGVIDGGRILQAKGRDYTLDALLAGREDLAAAFRDGTFATAYLAPRDYHRVHMPVDGRLLETVHVPGRLFSVAPVTTASIPRLFARNERLICLFRRPDGHRFAMILVGAMLVSSVETVWAGEVEPRRQVRAERFGDRALELAAGAEMGRFNMGSTVILLFEAGACRWQPLRPGQHLRMGERIGVLQGAAKPPPASPGAAGAGTGAADVQVPANASFEAPK